MNLVFYLFRWALLFSCVYKTVSRGLSSQQNADESTSKNNQTEVLISTTHLWLRIMAMKMILDFEKIFWSDDFESLMPNMKRKNYREEKRECSTICFEDI